MDSQNEVYSGRIDIVGGHDAIVGSIVTAKVIKFPKLANGCTIKDTVGYDAILKDSKLKSVHISNVTEISEGNFNITIESKNSEIIDLTSKSEWTLIILPLRKYVQGEQPEVRRNGGIFGMPRISEEEAERLLNEYFPQKKQTLT